MFGTAVAGNHPTAQIPGYLPDFIHHRGHLGHHQGHPHRPYDDPILRRHGRLNLLIRGDGKISGRGNGGRPRATGAGVGAAAADIPSSCTPAGAGANCFYRYFPDYFLFDHPLRRPINPRRRGHSGDRHILRLGVLGCRLTATGQGGRQQQD